LGSLSIRVVAVFALGGLGITGCAQNKGATVGAPSTGPTTSSCGISLCTPSTAPDTATTATTVAGGAPTASWVDAAANLAGLASECGNLSLLSARPDRDMVIAGVAQQGLWAITDGAATWAQLGQGAGSAKITNRTSSITYDPDHPGTFWESGIYNGGGAYLTTDNGATFKQLGNLIHSDDVSVDLSDPNRRTLLSGRHEKSNLFRSADGGATWVDISSKLPSGIGYTISPLVISASVHLLGTTAGTNSGVFRTDDGGATWTQVYSGPVSGPALVTKDGSIYWLLDQGKGIIKSTDKGVNWQPVPVSGPATPGASLIQLPDGRLAGITDTSVIVSADNGFTWSPIGPALPYSATGMIYAPFRKAFYVWKFDCPEGGGAAPVKPDSIERLDYALQTP
jgi:hypothetical protein